MIANIAKFFINVSFYILKTYGFIFENFLQNFPILKFSNFTMIKPNMNLSDAIVQVSFLCPTNIFTMKKILSCFIDQRCSFRFETILGNWKPFKNAFFLLSKLFLFSEYLLDQKDKANLKIYDVTS